MTRLHPTLPSVRLFRQQVALNARKRQICLHLAHIILHAEREPGHPNVPLLHEHAPDVTILVDKTPEVASKIPNLHCTNCFAPALSFPPLLTISAMQSVAEITTCIGDKPYTQHTAHKSMHPACLSVHRRFCMSPRSQPCDWCLDVTEVKGDTTLNYFPSNASSDDEDVHHESMAMASCDTSG